MNNNIIAVNGGIFTGMQMDGLICKRWRKDCDRYQIFIVLLEMILSRGPKMSDSAASVSGGNPQSFTFPSYMKADKIVLPILALHILRGMRGFDVVGHTRTNDKALEALAGQVFAPLDVSRAGPFFKLKQLLCFGSGHLVPSWYSTWQFAQI
ncbi:hypothetical protein BC835DRAFT_1307915 [Cytidiella melzeri]|nr:hypothetical protein BC835DRAFT_1309440 [Cytidiella melzeri]KAI0690400.1 hypothetical protein BC835DRAFT_1307915 [Cytidiella melzeri]